MLKIGDQVIINRPDPEYKSNPTWVEKSMARFVGKSAMVISSFTMWDGSEGMYLAVDGEDTGYTFSPAWLSTSTGAVTKKRGRPAGLKEKGPRKARVSLNPKKSQPNFSAIKSKDILAVAKENSRITSRRDIFPKEIVELAKAYARHEVTLRGVAVALEMDDANARHYMLKVWEELVKNLK